MTTPFTAQDEIESKGSKKTSIELNSALYKQRRIQSAIPRNKEEWLDFFVQMLKKKTRIEYLTEEEVKKVVIRARPNVNKKLPLCAPDKEMPICYFWTEEQVGEWISIVGFPQFKETFLRNFINGRRLILVDAAALSKMGLKNFEDIQTVTSKIREMLGIRRPNMLRAILRMSPFELYLKHRSHNGRKYDCMTFKRFCRLMKFPIRIVKKNKNATIPCSVSILLVQPEDEGAELSDEGSETSEISILETRSVEFIVRHQIVRNRTVQQMINDIVECLFDAKCARRVLGAGAIDDLMARLLEDAFLELGFCDAELYTKERIQFASEVAGEMLKEMRKTAEVLTDISCLKTHLKQDISPIELKAMQEITNDFMNQVGPVSALLSLGELNLEAIFKQEPEFQAYVDNLIEEAEKDAEEYLPIAQYAVRTQIEEAKTRVMTLKEFPHLGIETVRKARHFAKKIWGEMVSDAVEESYFGPGGDEESIANDNNEEEEEEEGIKGDGGYEEVDVVF